MVDGVPVGLVLAGAAGLLSPLALARIQSRMVYAPRRYGPGEGPPSSFERIHYRVLIWPAAGSWRSFPPCLRVASLRGWRQAVVSVNLMAVHRTQEDEMAGDPAYPEPSDFKREGGLDAPSLAPGPRGAGSIPGSLWNAVSRRFKTTFLDDVAVALGSDFVYVASREHPEPVAYAAYVALSKSNGQVIALGEKARSMVGREPQNLEVVRLLTHGVPHDPAMFSDFLQRVIKRHFASSRWMRPRVLCTGNFATPLLKNICTEGLFKLKARDIMFCEPELAAAVGMGLDILKPDLRSVLVFERDWMGFMVMSMSGSLTRLRLDIGFQSLLEDIQIYFEESNEFAPREEDLAQQFLKSGFTGPQHLIGWEAWVNQVERGKPVTIEADPEHHQKAVAPTLLRIKHAVNRSLQFLSREQRYVVQTTPTYLAGQYASLPGLRELLERVFGREVVLPSHPEDVMVSGLVDLIPNIDLLKAINGGEAGPVEL